MGGVVDCAAGEVTDCGWADMSVGGLESVTNSPCSFVPPHVEQLEIRYQDQWLVAVNKPSGLLVHRSLIDRRETRFALQIVRDQLGQRVYPIHRLDKPTSGVLLFALDPDTARLMGERFSAAAIEKRYVAVVRGYLQGEGCVDYPLKEVLDRMTDRKARTDKPAQPAVTHYRGLATVELPYEVDGYPQARYSLVELIPKSGRKHQLRRHMKHLSHPIIGDSNYGKGRHNRFFAEQLQAGRLLLHAQRIRFSHPHSQRECTITAGVDEVWQGLMCALNWDGVDIDLNIMRGDLR